MNKNQTKIPSKKNNHQKKNLLRQNNSVSKFNSKLGSKPLAKNSNFAGRGVWLYGKHPVFLALQKKRREIFQILATKNSVIELEKFLQEKIATIH